MSALGHPGEEIRWRECLDCGCVDQSTLFEDEATGGYYCPVCDSPESCETQEPEGE